MKLFFFAGILLLSACQLSATSEKPKPKPMATLQYAGTYNFHGANESGGSVSVYPETDSTVLFYIDVNRGAPSYNMGMLYGRMVIRDGKGTFSDQFEFEETGCKLNFTFSGKKLVVETVESQGGCGFGFSVYADGTFTRTSTKIPAYFQDGEGTKIYFKSTDPDRYNHE